MNRIRETRNFQAMVFPVTFGILEWAEKKENNYYSKIILICHFHYSLSVPIPIGMGNTAKTPNFGRS